MKTASEVITHDVGVIIGRFQVDKLHNAHKDLIQTVVNRHKKVLLFLGLAPTKGTKYNPLDFESRKQMILSDFPDINVLYISDCRSNKAWSKKLDDQINLLIGADQTAVLYGSRDSFISCYSGRYETLELVPEVFVSGTEIRKSISRKVMNDPKFRAGAIWLAAQGYDQVYATVDIAILNKEHTKLLMARRDDENLYRFVGGFSIPESPNFETDAIREAKEETGLTITFPEYICSAFIDDWRYRTEKSKIKTLFFISEKESGIAEAADDIYEVKWFVIDELKVEDIMPEHQQLFLKLLQHIKCNAKWGTEIVSSCR